MDQNSLKHYGVLGMRWGVRKNPQKAFAKAQKKMTRLDARQERLQKKAASRRYAFFTSYRRSRKLGLKADKATYRAAKWYGQIKDVFGAKKASELTNDKGVQMGQRYADWLIYGRR